MQPKKILIIEDDEPIRQMIQSLLEIQGYVIVTAKNGSEGLKLIQSDVPPDLILLDMMMPVANGWVVLDFLKSNAETAKIPVVIVSAYGETAKSARPDAYIPKPIQFGSLLDTIERLVA